MALTDMVIMPGADYQDACDAVREKTGSTAAIKSGDLGAQIRAIPSGGSVETCSIECTLVDNMEVDTRYKVSANVFEENEYKFKTVEVRDQIKTTIDNVVCGSVLATTYINWVTITASGGVTVVGETMGRPSVFQAPTTANAVGRLDCVYG